MARDVQNRWPERPILGALLHAAIVVVPLLIGVGVGYGLHGVLAGHAMPWGVPVWVVTGAVSVTAVWGLQPLVRRLLPLAWLLRLGMLFPGEAPSRFRVARRAGRVRDLEDRIAGDTGDGDVAQRNAEQVLTLVAALTAHDRRTRGHAERTRIFTDLLTEQLGMSIADRDRMRWAALLHDIGKLEVPERILNKAGKPTDAEWDVIKQHPVVGDRLMAPLRGWLGTWADTALHHHERYDGAGYPHGLAGDAISLGGRIVAVADSYEVMTAARSYKRPMSATAARAELVACSGTQFDPGVVRAFLLISVPRLRWALGPFAWVAQLPLFRDVVHVGTQVPATVSTVAAGAPAAAGAAAVAATVVMAPSVNAPPEPVVLETAVAGDTATLTPTPAHEPPPIELAPVEDGDLEVVASTVDADDAPSAEPERPAPSDTAPTPGPRPTQPSPSAPAPVPTEQDAQADPPRRNAEPRTPATAPKPPAPPPSPVPPVAPPSAGPPSDPPQDERPRRRHDSSDDSDDSGPSWDSDDSGPSHGSNDS